MDLDEFRLDLNPTSQETQDLISKKIEQRRQKLEEIEKKRLNSVLTKEEFELRKSSDQTQKSVTELLKKRFREIQFLKEEKERLAIEKLAIEKEKIKQTEKKESIQEESTQIDLGTQSKESEDLTPQDILAKDLLDALYRYLQV